MKKITAILTYSKKEWFNKTLQQFVDSKLIKKIFLVHSGDSPSFQEKCECIKTGALTSGKTLNRLLARIETEYFLVMNNNVPLILGQHALERFVDVAESTSAGIVYSDFYKKKDGACFEYSLIDYQQGSVRDDFDFGPLLLFKSSVTKKALKKYGEIENVEHAGLYDLRLKVSIENPIVHIPESLYTVIDENTKQRKQEPHFDYVDPKNKEVQTEMERVFTSYLKRVDAYLKPKFDKLPKSNIQFLVEASVIMPVRNRIQTVKDAIRSVVTQKTNFPFNCIVVDNHSTDGTTELIRRFTDKYFNVKHIIPTRENLKIGGCWNEALNSEYCGRYAVQLDSDDLYIDSNVLQKIVDEFNKQKCAMVIGSYKVVNLDLEEIPPGVIDHREWTPQNGRNNALRINGLGAPRAFDTVILRDIGGFPDVSYGEDYAVALRISRQYQIGRIYEPIYLCRRWSGNTDSKLSIEQANRNNFYKDKIRTIEILARQKLNKAGK